MNINKLFLCELAKEKRLTGSEYRIFLYLIAHRNSENFVKKTQSDISKVFKKQDSNISRGIRKLVELGYIKREREGRLVYFYILSDI